MKTEIPFQKGMDLNDVMEDWTRNRVSRNIYISDSRVVENTVYHQMGLTIPRIINSPGRPPIIRFIDLDNVASISTRKIGDRLLIDHPARQEIHENLEDMRNSLIFKAENAVMDSFGDRFLAIPKVQTGLNPIKEIMSSLIHMGEIPISQLKARMTGARADSYISFLESLDFITKDEVKIYPGNEINKYDLADIDERDTRRGLLNEVLKEGFRYLSEDLKIFILTPYLELSNAFYLQSHYAEGLIPLEHEEIGRHYDDMYQRARKKQPFQILANLMEISDAGILDQKGTVFSGKEELFNSFSKALPEYI